MSASPSDSVASAMELLGLGQPKEQLDRYKCPDCGGYFDAPHFCVGKQTGTSGLVYKKMRTTEEKS